MSTSNKVIELSVAETNRLRAELGLAPLRVAAAAAAVAVASDDYYGASANVAVAKKKKEEEETVVQHLELSMSETNALRERLGLAPLRRTASAADSVVVVVGDTGGSFQHAPAVNETDVRQAADRIERARLKRQVDEGIQTKFSAPSLGTTTTATTNNNNNNSKGGGDATKSWAQQMRANKLSTTASTDNMNEKDKQKKKLLAYNETDLKGLNVGHSMAELLEGSTTVLTLADAPLLKSREDDTIVCKVIGLNEDDCVRLENVNLAETQHVQAGLREKRQVELGMGRAGGYAGFDDDEFEELGGTQAPSRVARSGAAATAVASDGGGARAGTAKQRKKQKGFQIGAMLEEQDAALESNLFAIMQGGRAISLEPAQADVAASDFMTVQEEEALLRETKKKKKDGKFKKEKKKKEKKKSKRRTTESDDEEDDAEDAPPKKGLLEELEESAVETNASRKRRRGIGDDATGSKYEGRKSMEIDQKTATEGKTLSSKRTKYDQVMAKGNERSLQAFGGKKKPLVSDMMDDEPDDAFLNAALAKARRLNRLKEMSQQKKTVGADAVVAAVQLSNAEAASSTGDATAAAAGTIPFAVDETREFTRALLARTEQAEREQARKKVVKKEPTITAIDAMEVEQTSSKSVATTVVKEEEPEEDMDIHELSKQVKDDGNGVGLDGATGHTVPVGRGVGSIINLLKQTGEITRKNAGQEEMRGRAKDKRTYEDYEPLDLSKVVKIDESKANSKDKEFAHREIKLEYRDKHGRLLTRKEAFRDLSYQFHGYGSGKRKEEKKLEQIAREQAEARLASRQAAEGAGAGTFGALKATQQATGKAFVVHKTGN